MKYLKCFNIFNEQKISIFDDRWSQVIPKELTIVTSYGKFTLQSFPGKSELGHKKNLTNLMNWVNICYHQNTAKDGDVTKDGEPDFLCIDICFLKSNTGLEDNPDNLKLLVDITYGDSMMYEFNLQMPNQVEITHYDGYGSKYDSEYAWGFTDESVEELVNFFNSFGYRFTSKDFTFLDEHLDSYRPKYN